MLCIISKTQVLRSLEESVQLQDVFQDLLVIESMTQGKTS